MTMWLIDRSGNIVKLTSIWHLAARLVARLMLLSVTRQRAQATGAHK